MNKMRKAEALQKNNQQLQFAVIPKLWDFASTPSDDLHGNSSKDDQKNLKGKDC